MCPFSVTVQHVPDRELGPLLTRLAEAGFNNPTINHVDADPASAAAAARTGGDPLDLPEDWRLVRERDAAGAERHVELLDSARRSARTSGAATESTLWPS